MTQFKKIVSSRDIKKLLAYHCFDDDRTDSRPDVRSKHPRWDIDDWPQNIVKKILDKILDYDYRVEEVIINQSQISFRLHTDSGDGSSEALYGHTVIIPLLINGKCSTILFDNHWFGPSTRFSRTPIPPFSYQLPNKHGNWQKIEDLRELLKMIDSAPESIKDFEVTDEFRQTIVNLIEARSNKKISLVDDRTNDYGNITGYDKDLIFPADIHSQYLSHIPIENLQGLTFGSAIQWSIGEVIKFPRTQLHSAGCGHIEKIGITVFVRRL